MGEERELQSLRVFRRTCGQRAQDLQWTFVMSEKIYKQLLTKYLPIGPITVGIASNPDAPAGDMVLTI